MSALEARGPKNVRTVSTVFDRFHRLFARVRKTAKTAENGRRLNGAVDEQGSDMAASCGG
jgi:hypothetical protein